MLYVYFHKTRLLLDLIYYLYLFMIVSDNLVFFVFFVRRILSYSSSSQLQVFYLFDRTVAVHIVLLFIFLICQFPASPWHKMKGISPEKQNSHSLQITQKLFIWKHLCWCVLCVPEKNVGLFGVSGTFKVRDAVSRTNKTVIIQYVVNLKTWTNKSSTPKRTCH